MKIKLLHFSLKIKGFRSRRCFKRWNIFAEVFNSTIKDIHLALEVKPFFDNSTPATGSRTESSTQSLDFPLAVVNDIARREERRKLAHNS